MENKWVQDVCFCFLCCLTTFLLGAVIGADMARSSIEKEAVKIGFGHYDEGCFQWDLSVPAH
jgi:hypothetical protein